ncbi:MAG: right-handed parallel beta-helix repeat-containing protein [Candidatus Rokuibacteriota bacterium]
MLRLVAIALLVITLGAPGPALAVAPLTRACQAPPLPPPAGAVVEVTTEAELQAAVASLASGTTVLLRPGVYVLTSTLWLDGDVDHVAIRGSTDSCDAAVLVGRGMANADFGGVPHGIWIGNARHVLVANLTIRDVYYHPVQLDPAAGAHAPRVYNVRMVDAGEQFVKSSADAQGGPGVADGVVEYSVMEYTTTARSDYTNGVDVHTGANWVVRNNLFRNIRAPEGQLAGPAVLMWNRSVNTIVEGNLFLNVQYGIALGLDPGRLDDHAGGIVRNNVFHRSSAQSGDVGIVVNNSAGTRVLHNTVILSGTYPNAIEYRFAATTGVDIRYNLTDAAVRQRDGASGTVSSNVTDAPPHWFVDAGAGDLHLTAAAAGAIDQAAPLPEVTLDYDGEPRSSGAAPDVGADEVGPGSPAPLVVTVAVNQASFAPGSTLSASVGVVNPGLPDVVEFYLGVLLPGAQTVVLLTEGGGVSQAPAVDVAAFPPVARNVSLAGPFAVSVPGFLVHTWTGGEPRGAYLLFLVAVRPGALADGAVDPGDLLAAGVASFVFP